MQYPSCEMSRSRRFVSLLYAVALCVSCITVFSSLLSRNYETLVRSVAFSPSGSPELSVSRSCVADEFLPSVLKSGMPQQSEYGELLSNELYLDMEKYAESFNSRHAQVLQEYGQSWVVDSFHWWSRVYEYPYVYSRLMRYACGKRNLRVLDIGAGVSFFPWLIQSRLGLGSTMLASDFNPKYPAWYKRINLRDEAQVSFSGSDMRNDVKEFRDGEYDIIYSISVLEHTDSYASIIQNVKRMLKPGGRFILTFDVVAENEVGSIPLSEAEEIFRCLRREFVEVEGADLSLLAALSSDPVVPATFPNFTVEHLLGKRMSFTCHEFVKPEVTL